MRTRTHRVDQGESAHAHPDAIRGAAPWAISETILDTIGRTPLIPLHRLGEGLPARILVKLESLNPGGSIKDRVGVAMVDEAERRGWLRPGGTIIEATAGNTGVGLALAASVKGYRCIFVLPDKMSGEKIRLLKAYGAEIVITATAVPPDSPESYNGVADRLAREIPEAWRPNQFANLANPEVHYQTTGPEIWEQTEGQITVFVAGVGTGGTEVGVITISAP
jgi:cystathionine beta-synthase